VGKKGVVRDPAVHMEVIEKIIGFSKNLGFAVKGLTYSPVKGPEGNIEYLLYLIMNSVEHNPVSVEETVNTAHEELK